MGWGKRVWVCYQEFNIFQHRLMQWQKISPCYQQNVSTIYFFPKLNTTVKIHRAQRIHICSTHYTLYKLDRYNLQNASTPVVLPQQKVFQWTIL